MNCLLIIRHQNSNLDEIARYLYKFGNIYLRINAIGGTSVFGIIVRPSMEDKIILLKEISSRDLLRVAEKDSTTSITSEISLSDTILRILN